MCDLLTQDCPAGQTCSVRATDAGPLETYCIDFGDGTKGLGEACASHGECGAPLRCMMYKCTRPCCTNMEDPICGVAGDCDYQFSIAGAKAFMFCTFPPPCTLWAGDCPAAGPETDCHPDNDGQFSCSSPNYNPDAGSTLGQPCSYLNDCQDSQHCIYESGASAGTCRWLCKFDDSGGPSTGTVGGPPGKGGCDSGKTCKAFNTPSWLGYCD